MDGHNLNALAETLFLFQNKLFNIIKELTVVVSQIPNIIGCSKSVSNLLYKPYKYMH